MVVVVTFIIISSIIILVMFGEGNDLIFFKREKISKQQNYIDYNTRHLLFYYMIKIMEERFCSALCSLTSLYKLIHIPPWPPKALDGRKSPSKLARIYTFHLKTSTQQRLSAQSMQWDFSSPYSRSTT